MKKCFGVFACVALLSANIFGQTIADVKIGSTDVKFYLGADVRYWS